MKKCPYCGAAIQENAQFCLYCMKSLKSKTDITPKKSKRAFPISVIVTSVIVVILIVTGSVFLAKQTGSSTTDTDDPKQENANTSEKNDTDKEEALSLPVNTEETDTAQDSTKSTDSTASLCENGHTWSAVTSTVHHDEAGHYENVQTGTETVSVYKCAVCYGKFDSYDLYYSHFQTEHIAKEDELVIIFLDRYELSTESMPIYEKKWIVDTPAYDEEIITGYICSVCNIEKQP